MMRPTTCSRVRESRFGFRSGMRAAAPPGSVCDVRTLRVPSARRTVSAPGIGKVVWMERAELVFGVGKNGGGCLALKRQRRSGIGIRPECPLSGIEPDRRRSGDSIRVGRRMDGGAMVPDAPWLRIAAQQSGLGAGLMHCEIQYRGFVAGSNPAVPTRHGRIRRGGSARSRMGWSVRHNRRLPRLDPDGFPRSLMH